MTFCGRQLNMQGLEVGRGSALEISIGIVKVEVLCSNRRHMQDHPGIIVECGKHWGTDKKLRVSQQMEQRTHSGNRPSRSTQRDCGAVWGGQLVLRVECGVGGGWDGLDTGMC